VTPASSLRRLKKRAQFLKAARGTKVARRGFVLQATSVGETSPGIGYTVTRKAGNAPERNRIKRRLRAAVAKCSGALVAGFDYVLIGRREALNEPFDVLVNGLSGSIRRIHSENGQQAERVLK
jgi:ribonuclease P protein component